MKELRFAVKNTIPIFFTYLFIGIAFGILMSDAGYSILLTTASSLFIYAGSMQLVMVPMMTSGARSLRSGGTPSGDPQEYVSVDYCRNRVLYDPDPRSVR